MTLTFIIHAKPSTLSAQIALLAERFGTKPFEGGKL